MNMYHEIDAQQLIDFPTRYRNDQSSLLNIFLTNDPKSIFDLCYEPPIGRSDHVGQNSIKNFAQKTQKIVRKHFYTANYERQSVNNEKPIFENFQNILNGAIKKYIPTKPVKTNPQNHG